MLALHTIMGHGFCTITGDQSLSEAISRGCSFYYVKANWKHHLFEHLTRRLPCLTEVVKQMDKKDHKKAASVIYENQENFIQFCEYVRTNRNLGRVIINRLRSLPSLDAEQKVTEQSKKESDESASRTQPVSSVTSDSEGVLATAAHSTISTCTESTPEADGITLGM